MRRPLTVGHVEARRLPGRLLHVPRQLASDVHPAVHDRKGPLLGYQVLRALRGDDPGMLRRQVQAAHRLGIPARLRALGGVLSRARLHAAVEGAGVLREILQPLM